MVHKCYAPQCALPRCISKVSYHNKNTKKSTGTGSYKWKNFCEFHRKEGKSEVDRWKMKQGCANIDAHHGFKCTATILGPEQLQVNHQDGNRQNTDIDNLEILCANCHARVTISENHHLNRYDNSVSLSKDLWEV